MVAPVSGVAGHGRESTLGKPEACINMLHILKHLFMFSRRSCAVDLLNRKEGNLCGKDTTFILLEDVIVQWLNAEPSRIPSIRDSKDAVCFFLASEQRNNLLYWLRDFMLRRTGRSSSWILMELHRLRPWLPQISC